MPAHQSRRALRAAAAIIAVPLLGGAALAATAASGAGARPHQAQALVFDGRGFGHGVGMSQYGARGQALRGATHADILGHYYPGTALATIPRRAVRVLLADGAPSAALTSARPARAVGRVGSRARAVPVPARVVHRVRALPGGHSALERGGRRVAVFRGPLRVQAVRGATVIAWGERAPERSRRYRGALRVGPADGGGLRVVNVVGLEDYLRGVVAREMPASWGDDTPEALRAQAVAARSYALATRRLGDDFDLYDDTRSQVYGGVPAEDVRATRAIVATRGRVVTHEGAIATTFFHSTSGGRTESSPNAWPGADPVPYLASVADPADAISPLHTWTRRFTTARLGTLLGVGAPVTAVQVLERGDSPRVLRARVRTADGRAVVLTGAQIRARTGIPDTWFTVRPG